MLAGAGDMAEDAASPRPGVCVIINISGTRLRNKKAFSLDSCRFGFLLSSFLVVQMRDRRVVDDVVINERQSCVHNRANMRWRMLLCNRREVFLKIFLVKMFGAKNRSPDARIC